MIEEFKCWYQEQQGTKKIPKGIELFEFMDKKYAKLKKGTGWKNLSMASYYVEEVYEPEDDN